jgi:hypothetical protein
MADNALKKSVCPSCGAPVSLDQMPDDATEVTCVYCGTILRAKTSTPKPAAPQPTVIKIDLGSLGVPDVPERPRPTQSGGFSFAGCIGLLVILFSALATVFAVVPPLRSWLPEPVRTRVSGSDVVKSALEKVVPAPIVTLPLGIVPQDAAGAPDLMAVVTDDYNTYSLARISPVTREARWRTAVNKEFSGLGVKVVDDTALAVDGDTLQAYDIKTGQSRWRVGLARPLQTSCDDCLMVVGQQVVTLARDGTLQTHDVRTGAPGHTKRLDTSTRNIWPLGDKYAVVEPTGRPGANSFNIYSAASGERVRAIDLKCKPPNDREQDVRNNGIQLTPDGTSLVLLSDTTPCAARIEVATGRQVWVKGATRNEGWPFSMFAFGNFAEVTNQHVVLFSYDGAVNKDGAMTVIEMQTGASRRFDVPRDYELKPLGMSGEGTSQVLVLQARNRVDNSGERVELWGMDLAGGRRAWNSVFTPQTGNRMDNISMHASRSGGYLTYNIDRNIYVYRVNPQNGVSTAPLVIPSDFPSMRTRWDDELLSISSGRTFRAVDLRTMTVVTTAR